MNSANDSSSESRTVIPVRPSFPATTDSVALSSGTVDCFATANFPTKHTNHTSTNLTRLPSNLMQTTHKCVHLVRRGHLRSRDKDVVTPFDLRLKPHPASKPHDCTFYRTGVIANHNFMLWE